MLCDEVGVIFPAGDFQALYSTQGAPGVSGERLALVTVVQSMEDLSEREAAEAVRSRAQRAPDRQELVGEMLHYALNAVAEVAPTWLQGLVPVAWYERYQRRIEGYRLPKAAKARNEWVLQVGQDGQHLLQWLAAADVPAELAKVTAVATLRTVWSQQLHLDGESVRWRQAGELPSAAGMVQSP